MKTNEAAGISRRFCYFSQLFLEKLLTLYGICRIIKSQARGSRVKRKEKTTPPERGVRRLTEEQIKELLELLKKALESETVERITISIKPNKKNKQP